MKAIRHYIFVLVGLGILYFVIGLGPTLWVALALIAVLTVHTLPNVVTTMAERPRSQRELEQIMRTSQTRAEVINRYSKRKWAMPLVLMLTYFSILLWVVAIVLLWIRFGWITALGYIVLSLGYLMLRETREAKRERAVRGLRASLRESIARRIAGSITDEQLDERAYFTLKQNLPEEALYLESLRKLLWSEEGMNTSEYQAYVKLLERYLSKVR